MNNRAKRHHYLPQSYLRRWCSTESGKLWVYDKQGGAPRPQAPVNTGVEKNLYTVLDSEGKPSDILESSVFQHVDAQAAEVMQRWSCTPMQYRPGDKRTIAAALGVAHTRVPAMIDTAERMQELGYVALAERFGHDRDELNELFEEVRRDDPEFSKEDEETVADLLKNARSSLNISVDRQAAMALAQVIAADVAREILGMRNWRFRHAPDGWEFVTTDTPLVVFARDQDDMALFGAGVGLQHAEVSFAISPKRVLYIDRALNREVPPCEELQRRAVFQARRFVLATTPNAAVEQLVAEFAGSYEKRGLDEGKTLEWWHSELS